MYSDRSQLIRCYRTIFLSASEIISDHLDLPFIWITLCYPYKQYKAIISAVLPHIFLGLFENEAARRKTGEDALPSYEVCASRSPCNFSRRIIVNVVFDSIFCGWGICCTKAQFTTYYIYLYIYCGRPLAMSAHYQSRNAKNLEPWSHDCLGCDVHTRPLYRLARTFRRPFCTHPWGTLPVLWNTCTHESTLWRGPYFMSIWY